jgi:hypothetical protein
VRGGAAERDQFGKARLLQARAHGDLGRQAADRPTGEKVRKSVEMVFSKEVASETEVTGPADVYQKLEGGKEKKSGSQCRLLDPDKQRLE